MDFTFVVLLDGFDNSDLPRESQIEDVAASARRSQFIFSGSRRVLIFIAARQAIEAAIARRKSSSEARRSSLSEISRISNSSL